MSVQVPQNQKPVCTELVDDGLQIMSYEVEAVTKPRILGEGPHWDVETQNLYFVDDFGSSIHRYNPAENRETYCKIDESAPVSIVIPLKNTTNKFVVTVGKNLTIVTWDGETTSPEKVEIIATVDEEPGNEKNQFNDGKVDPTGRLWVGTMGPIGLDGSWSPEKGSLYSFTKGGTPKKHLEKLSIANGLIWNKDETKMFYIDSPTRRIDVLDFDPKLGEISAAMICDSRSYHLEHVLAPQCFDWLAYPPDLTHIIKVTPYNTVVLYGVTWKKVFFLDDIAKSVGNRRLFFDVSPLIKSKDGGPDGMTIDSDDNLWFAVFGEGAIFNINGTTGELIRRIDVPSKNPTSVAFGGPNLDELYVTSASFGLSDEEKSVAPTSGSTYKIKGLGVTGRPMRDADL